MSDDPDDRRVCPEDGKTYTFGEFECEFCAYYSPDDLDAAWDRMKPPGQQPPSAASTLTHVSVSANSLVLPPEPTVVDLSIVELAERGDVDALTERLRAGCNPNVVAFEYRRYPGTIRVYCNDWTPLTAAVVAGKVAAVELLLKARADVNVACSATTASGSYNHWTALDCARTGETIPYERDPSKSLQPRHPETEKLLLDNGAKPASQLPEPAPVNTYGNLPESGERSNPCIDEEGGSYKPPYLFTAEELEEMRSGKAGTKLVKGAKCGMASLGQDGSGQGQAGAHRVYAGGSVASSGR